MRRFSLGLVLACTVLPANAASLDHARQVITMVYDIGLYQSELDRIMDEADSRGVYGGQGSTATSRLRDKNLTHATMLAQREAVLSVATSKLAGRASDEQLTVLLRMAATGTEPADPRELEATVGAVKSSFSDAFWERLASAARGNSMFPCSRDARSRC